MMSFYVHEVAPSVVALAVLLAIVASSLWILFRNSYTAEERRFATSTLWAVVTGVIGFAFGKAKK